jgi:ribosome biogenesis protein MAK21
VLFYFEDQLKLIYADFLKNIERIAKAPQAFLRDPAVRCIGNLLRAKAEAERALLAILVDRLGDPLKHVASAATTAIMLALGEHPQMTQAVVGAIKSRQPGVSPEAEKRAMKFLGRLSVAGQSDASVRELFETVGPQLLQALKSADESNSKVLQTLMKSAEKCASVCGAEEMSSLVTPLYRFVKTAPLTTSLPALQLLYSIHSATAAKPPKFYRFLYALVLDRDFQCTSKLPQILNFILRVLSDEDDPTIVASFIHRILPVGLHITPAFSIAALVLVAQLFDEKPELRAMFTSVNPAAEHTFNVWTNVPAGDAALQTFPWILSLYVSHFHPTVKAIASDLIAGRSISYDGDPFDEFGSVRQLKRLTAGPSDEDETGFLISSLADFDDIADFADF